MKQMKDYSYHIGLKVRAYPSRQQIGMIYKNIGCSRFVYNRCIAIGRELHQLRKVAIYSGPIVQRIGFLETQKGSIREISNLAPFLNGPDIDNQALHMALSHYNKAWEQFREVPGTGIPTFHKKQAGGSYQTCAHYNKEGKVSGAYFIDDTHVKLPKVGIVRVKSDKEYVRHMLANAERLGTFTVKVTASGGCYISVSLASDTPFFSAMPKTGSAWGFDANVKNLLTGSDGEVVDNPAFLREAEEELAKQQRILSRRFEAAKKRCPAGMKLGAYLRTCKNYQEQHRKVASIQERIARQRADYIHCTTKREVKNHDLIAAEDLKIKNLLKNHCLARSISDVGWGGLFRQFKYKSEQYGKTFIQVPPHYTTQTCSACGYVLKGEERLTLDDREWTCPHCGVHHDRDTNSAVNILNKALSLMALA